MRLAKGKRTFGVFLRATACAGILASFAGPALGQDQVKRVPTEAEDAAGNKFNVNNGDGMDTHLFRPAIDSKGFFYVNGSEVLGANDISFGLVLDYGRNLMRTNEDRADGCGGANQDACPNGGTALDRGVDSLAKNSFQGTFGFNYGIANYGVVGLTIPVILMAGDEANELGRNGNLYNTGKLDEQSISTVAVHGKLRLLRLDRGPGLAFIIQAGIPVGAAPRNLGADPGAWYWPRLALENRFFPGGPLKVGLDVGYRGHTGKNPRFEKDAGGRDQLQEGKFEYGNLGTFGLGVSLRVLESLDLVGETYGSILTGGNSDSKQKISQELLGGIKLFIERNSYLMMGAGTRKPISTGFEAADVRLVLGFVFEPTIGDRDGDGYKDDVDKCPDEPEDFDGYKDEDGCPDPDNDNDGIPDADDHCPNTPEDFDGYQDQDGCPEGNPYADRDHDGIPDNKDHCPDQPEDRDGFQDEDGCPDLDNDHDQIPDKQDKCPNDPETYNGFEDTDGCPDKGKVIIEGSEIVILEKVQFETGSAKILASSKDILDQVAATLKGHPDFQLVEIGGHADERANDDYNLRLTKDRAGAVVDALVKRGTDRKRLVPMGYGEYCPLDAGHTQAAYDKNRRVEFKVVKTEDGPTGVERGCENARKKGVNPPAAGK